MTSESPAPRFWWRANAVYATALAGLGKLDEAQVDSSYDFSPSRFVAEQDVVQQGFATSEPYAYENTIEQWGRPVGSMLIHDAGYPNYGSVVSVRQEDVVAEADCLERLVPVLQQSVVDYVSDPSEINELIGELSVAWEATVVVDEAANTFASDVLLDLGLVDNGANATLGDLDEDRVQLMIDLTVPVFIDQGIDDPGVTVDSLVTNQFVDEAVGL